MNILDIFFSFPWPAYVIVFSSFTLLEQVFCMRLTLLPLLFDLRECGAKLLAFLFLLFDIMRIDVGTVNDFIFQWGQGLILLVRNLFILVQPPFLFFISFCGATHFSTLHTFRKMKVPTSLTVGSCWNFNNQSLTHSSWLWLVRSEIGAL